jgi:hypothetical protein
MLLREVHEEYREGACGRIRQGRASSNQCKLECLHHHGPGSPLAGDMAL